RGGEVRCRGIAEARRGTINDRRGREGQRYRREWLRGVDHVAAIAEGGQGTCAKGARGRVENLGEGVSHKVGGDEPGRGSAGALPSVPGFTAGEVVRGHRLGPGNPADKGGD